MATLSAQQVYAAARGAGASHQEAIILTAIARGESGFANNAHNPKPPDNSYGLWQINMLGQMGVNRAQQWGLPSYESLFDPRVNAKAALSILRSQGLTAWSVYSSGAYKQYMSEATAAGNAIANDWTSVARSLNKAWDSAPATSGSTAGDMGYLGGATTGAGGAGSATYNPTNALPPNASPEQIEDYIRENYPQMSGFLDIPEIRNKLIEAARGEWTPAKLQAEIQATTWWRTHAEATRQYIALEKTDPAQKKALLQQKIAELAPQLAELGLPSTGGFVTMIADSALRFGWTPDQLRAKLAGHLTAQSGKTGLQQESAPDMTADKLMQIARTEYFVPIGRQDAERWAIAIFQGQKTEESLRDYFMQLAASRFPGLTEQGFTPGEYMAPVRNIIAETLEINPLEVDLLDPRWAAVLEQEGSDGKLRPMSIGEAARWARSRPEYQSTQGALEKASNVADFLGRTFGAV